MNVIGYRAQILHFGLNQFETTRTRAAWQEKSRKMLYYLMMGGNPEAV